MSTRVGALPGSHNRWCARQARRGPSRNRSLRFDPAPVRSNPWARRSCDARIAYSARPRPANSSRRRIADAWRGAVGSQVMRFRVVCAARSAL